MAKHKCAVIIPTKNALPIFQNVLEAILRQKTEWPFEIIVIDSGSTDGTTDFIRSFPEVRLIDIDPRTFGHGRTRNQAIAASDAEFVAFLTHDAQPFDENWLTNLVAAAEQNERIAGVFGRHVAYDTASPFTKADLDKHFKGFMAHPLVVDRDTDPKRYENDIGWRQFLHFYSDNNSLMRKSIWEKHPYPDVEFAEDQIWARDMIDLGYKKAYAPNAIVYHSHDYNVLEQLRRAFDESRNFKKYFGYRLGPSLGSLPFVLIRSTVKVFRQRMDQEKYGNVCLKNRLSRSLRQNAVLIGHYLGANQERLPVQFKNRLSLDYRLFKS